MPQNQIESYLLENKDKYPKEVLVAELKKAGYSDDIINLAVNNVYNIMNDNNHKSDKLKKLNFWLLSLFVINVIGIIFLLRLDINELFGFFWLLVFIFLIITVFNIYKHRPLGYMMARAFGLVSFLFISFFFFHMPWQFSISAIVSYLFGLLTFFPFFLIFLSIMIIVLSSRCLSLIKNQNLNNDLKKKRLYFSVALSIFFSLSFIVPFFIFDKFYILIPLMCCFYGFSLGFYWIFSVIDAIRYEITRFIFLDSIIHWVMITFAMVIIFSEHRRPSVIPFGDGLEMLFKLLIALFVGVFVGIFFLKFLFYILEKYFIYDNVGR